MPTESLAGQVTAAGAGPQGGPTVPALTVNTVDIVPVAVVVTRAENEGALQLTEMVELTTPPSSTVGWAGSLLHSRILPIELLVNPLPVRVTFDPLTRPVVGVAVIVPAAKADTVVPNRTEPDTTRSDATTMRALALVSRPFESTVVILDRPELITTHPSHRPPPTSAEVHARRGP